MADITVQLPDDVETHQGYVRVAVLREPTARLFFELGEPQQWVRDQSGTVTVLDNSEVIQAYLDRSIALPLTPVTLGSMSLANGIAVRDAMLSFFGEARRRMSAAPSNSSALNSDGSTPAPSAA